jgi:hypothetical protein
MRRTELVSTRPLELVLQTIVQGLEKQSTRLHEQEREMVRLSGRCSELETVPCSAIHAVHTPLRGAREYAVHGVPRITQGTHAAHLS